MSFKPWPYKIIFSFQRNHQDHPPFLFSNIDVKQCLTLDSKIAFVNDINENLSKVRKSVGVIKYLSSSVREKNLDQKYKICVRPHLGISDVI